jgi:hypothetical protein
VEFKNQRLTVFLCVLLFHGIIAALLIRSSRLRVSVDQTFALELLLISGPANPGESSTTNSASKLREIKTPELGIRTLATPAEPNEQPLASSAITSPPIDWELEAEVVAQNSVGERLYRDLAGFTPEQLEWMKRNQMAPAPYNPFWDDGRRVDEPGVLWINDDCAIVNLLPVCRIKLGKRKVRGDLFKDMRKYLDERETDPLP